MSNLIIVESPTKAKTLSRFLGNDYSVEATTGHIKDLPKSTLGVDIEKSFKPEYIIVSKRSDTIQTLKRKAKESKEIFLATDPDREGEAIAAHVKEIFLENKNTSKKPINRIVFHEITKEAVEDAISHPRGVDVNLVDAQIARRVLDRLVGYKLSPLLWKKVRRGLSAGRVQSVAVRLIVEREAEIEAFKALEYWEIYANVKTTKSPKVEFVTMLIKIDGRKAEVGDEKTAKKIVSDLEKAEYNVFEVKNRTVSKNPFAPFTTSTMTQSAARLFGWSAKRTMQTAQKLYEEGLITYHRTDSLNLSADAVSRARTFIEKQYGKNYLPEGPRFYKTKSKSAQEAHEAIRPTDISLQSTSMQVSEVGRDAERLYDLIWKRFIACQMERALYDETTIDIKAANYLLRASGQVMKFDGWRKVMPGRFVEDVVELPKVAKDDKLDLIKVDPQQKFTQPPARYNEASLIKTLEKLGIGRPSTYAPIISTIQIRNYVEKDEGKFFPTSIGIAVTKFLIDNFPKVFDYDFTAQMEDGLDEVAEGKRKWTREIGEFWNPFSKKLDDVEKKAQRVKIETEKLNKPCPECKEGELVIRVGRFGKFISCSRFPDCKYTDKFVEKINIRCPECKEGEVVLKRTQKGRKFYGCSRYPECKFASWRKPQVDGPSKTQ